MSENKPLEKTEIFPYIILSRNEQSFSTVREREYIRVVHVKPPQFAAHVQTPGLEHQPPLKHPDGQTAE